MLELPDKDFRANIIKLLGQPITKSIAANDNKKEA